MHTHAAPYPVGGIATHRVVTVPGERKCRVGLKVEQITDKMAKKDRTYMQLKTACGSQVAYLLPGDSDSKQACCCKKLDSRLLGMGRPKITDDSDCTVYLSIGSGPTTLATAELGLQAQELDKLVKQREEIEKQIQLAKKQEVDDAKLKVTGYEKQVEALAEQILKMKTEMQKAKEQVVKIEEEHAKQEMCKKCGAPVDENGTYTGNCACKMAHDHSKAKRKVDQKVDDDDDDDASVASTDSASTAIVERPPDEITSKPSDSLMEARLHVRRCAGGECEDASRE